MIDGHTVQQGFLLGWSQAWRDKACDERSMQLLTTDSNSLPKFCADGAAFNHDGFHEAFGTQPGDEMFKVSEQRIRIW